MADTQIVAGCSNSKHVETMVPLYSYGYERKVKKTLSHLKGIYSVMVDHNQQKVTVRGICNKYDVLSTVRRKRKDARFWKLGDTIVIEMEQEEEKSPSALAPESKSASAPPSLAAMKAAF